MKKQIQEMLLGTLIITLLSACGGTAPYYLSPNFKMKATAHKTVAILPFEVITNGTPPEGLTASRKQQIEEEETKSFQQSLYNGLSNNMGRSSVQIQPPNKTNNLLRERGINITQISQKNPEDLAKILGVDAVVFATVTKYRYMDEKTSMGINLGKTALNEATGGAAHKYTKGVSSKTNDIKVTCSLIEARDGDVLWKINDDQNADWKKPAGTVIDGLNQRLAEYFPYKYLKNR
jgi:TolB-like protein